MNGAQTPPMQSGWENQNENIEAKRSIDFANRLKTFSFFSGYVGVTTTFAVG